LAQLDFAKKCITHKLTKNWVPSITGNAVTIALFWKCLKHLWYLIGK